jgi:hypothetical protein
MIKNHPDHATIITAQKGMSTWHAVFYLIESKSI